MLRRLLDLEPVQGVEVIEEVFIRHSFEGLTIKTEHLVAITNLSQTVVEKLSKLSQLGDFFSTRLQAKTFDELLVIFLGWLGRDAQQVTLF